MYRPRKPGRSGGSKHPARCASRRPALRFRPSALVQISATGIPSAPCFKMNAFSASENFEALIVPRSSQPGIGARNSTKNAPVSGLRSNHYRPVSG